MTFHARQGFIPAVLAVQLIVTHSAPGQVGVFPYAENFDVTSPPLLPAGWESTMNRSPGTPDVTVSQSAPRSAPNCVSVTNGTVAQSLATPEFDFTGVVPDRISWFMRRSSTFIAPVVVEYATDGGASWCALPGDTLFADGSVTYVESTRYIPRSLSGNPRVRLRWRVVPAPTGSAGTLRFDDVTLTVHSASDLALVRVAFDPPLPRVADPVNITATVKNVGLTPMAGFSVALYRNCGDTVHPVPCDLIARSLPQPSLDPGDSALIALPGVYVAGGMNPLVAVLTDSADSDQSDNLLNLEIDVASRPGGVVINEIMFAPLSGEGEYVEFLNSGDQPVTLSQWRLTAGSTSSAVPKTMILPFTGPPLLPGKCAVAAEDSGIFRFFPALSGAAGGTVVIPRIWETRLNNAGGCLWLADSRGLVVDSVCYSPSWHNPAVIDRTGRSLERILGTGNSNDPGNWSTCTLPEGGTPGAKNSVALSGIVPEGTVAASPNPFSPDGDGVDDATVIHYRIPAGVWSVSVRIFDARGRAIRTLATCAPSTGEGECVWDGRDGERVIARMGIYVVFVEATDAGRLSAFSAKGVVVLAHRLR